MVMGSFIISEVSWEGKKRSEPLTGATRQFRAVTRYQVIQWGAGSLGVEPCDSGGCFSSSTGVYDEGVRTGSGVEVDIGLSTWLRWAKGLAAPQDSR